VCVVDGVLTACLAAVFYRHPCLTDMDLPSQRLLLGGFLDVYTDGTELTF